MSLFLGNKDAVKNPYVSGAEGKAIWNDRYENLKESISWWRRAFIASIVLSVILALVIAKIATESRVQPFVVETNKGIPYAIRPIDATLSANDQRLINFALDEFIINTRTVLSDPQAEAMLLDKAYAYAADGALDTLQSWFTNNNPYDIAKEKTVSINIIDAMPLSKNTWQIIWDETPHLHAGEAPSITTRWIANLSYRIGDINPKFVNQNPFGLYITDVSWSKSQQH